MKRFLLCLLILTLLFGLSPAGAEESAEDWMRQFVRVDGDTLTVQEGVSALGSCWGKWIEVDGEEEYIEPGAEEMALFADSFSLDRWTVFPDAEDGAKAEITRIRLPETLRALGSEAICYFSLTAFTLPEALEKIYADALYYCAVDTLRIECALPWDDLWTAVSENRILNYDTPEGHPLYQAIDGVLFSADGKTLLSYPSGRRDTHYDVPAGVEKIGKQAFYGACLQTISLPIGLKEVDDYAFLGCTRLQAVALPLTVTSVGEDVFCECVSLELVSLPDGLRADRDEESGWVVYYPDSALYRGDNGDTLKADAWELGDEIYQDANSLWEPGRLNGHGQGVPVYKEADGDETVLTLPDGAFVYLKWCSGNRVLLGTPIDWDGEYGWAAIENVEFSPGETLFAYSDIVPRLNARAWKRYLPAPGMDAETEEMPAFDRDVLSWHLFGPVVTFHGYYGGYTEENIVAFGCAVQDTEICRVPDGTDNAYAIMYSEDPFSPIPLLNGPDGAQLEALPGGTQVKILSETENGYFVTTGFTEGWVSVRHILIVPARTEN
ncbi:MAG: leucine-rich repeat domain-containing protein [Clostridia bacterium]|nr:leucine-rich repeat domain-containing protein [Clostridia bacterium]